MNTPLIGTQGAAPELAQLVDSVQAFVRDKTDHRRTRALRQSETGFDPALLAEMAGLGWTGILVPEDHGGLGLGVAALAAVAKELGRGLLAEPLAALAAAGAALARGDNAGLQEQLLPAIAAGEKLPALAWQEAADGSDALDPQRTATTAKAEGGAIRLSGRKRWVAGGADGFIVSARGADGVALYWLPPGAAGVQVQAQRQLDGSLLRTLVLQDVHAAGVVASPRVAVGALGAAVDTGAALACAELCGVMEFALETTLEYLRTRVQYDRIIGSFQALQHKTVDLYVQQELALSAVLDAVAALDAEGTQEAPSRPVSRAKVRCSEAGVRIAREAIQLHGAIGFTEEHDIGLYLKRALALAAAYGNADQHRARHAALGRPQH